MPTVELIPCPQCGTRFQRKKSWQKFCTDICRVKFHHEKREQAVRFAKAYGLLQSSTSWQKEH